MNQSKTSANREKVARVPRRAAWEFLQDVERDGSYVNLAIGPYLETLDSRDRPFATELIYGSVRMRRWIDHVIDQVVDRHLDPELRALLRLACYEALEMSSADHAIVNEYVDIAKAVIGRARAGLVNAVMRRVVREKEQLKSQKTSLGVRTSHPDWIVRTFAGLLAEEELSHELESHNSTPPVHVVSFNLLDDQLAAKSPLTPFGYRLKVQPRNLPAIASGEAFVQDEGSQLVCEVALATDPRREFRWLDLCAGPGGKFAYLAHFLDSNHLEGNEFHAHRANLVSKRTPGYTIHVGDGRQATDAATRFDRILLDAPCTGLGALRRRPDARWRKNEDDLKNLVSLQRELLDASSDRLTASGLIIYITCSPHPLETSAQVNDFLKRHSEFEIRPIDPSMIPNQLRGALRPEGTMQLMTGRDGTDAMFIALLQKGSA